MGGRNDAGTDGEAAGSSFAGGTAVRATTAVGEDGRYALEDEVEGSGLYRRDLAPTPARLRDWGLYSYLAFWTATAIAIPTWSLANAGLAFGIGWTTTLLLIALGNAIVTVPLLLNAHAGARYGIPFPVYARAAFGVSGAKLAVVLRSVVACGWFGIETWLGGFAIYVLLSLLIPGFEDPPGRVEWLAWPGPRQLATFALFLAIQVWVAMAAPPWKGARAIRTLVEWSAPLLLAAMLLLVLYLGLTVPGGFPALLDVQLAPEHPQSGSPYWWWLLLNVSVGLWGTMAVSVADVSRFARGQARQTVGQAAGLIGTMALFPALGLLATRGGTLLFPQTAYDTANQLGTPNDLWNPINLFALLTTGVGPIVIVLALGFVALAQLTTNVGANLIAAANGFQGLSPRRLSWRWGVALTALIAVLMQPWALFFNAIGYTIVALSGFGALLAAIAGITIADYWLLRKGRLNLDDLYRVEGIYGYDGSGVNGAAVLALVVGVVPPAIGWLHRLGLYRLPGYQGSLLDWIQIGSWFWSFFAALIVYFVAMRLAGRPYVEERIDEEALRQRAEVWVEHGRSASWPRR